MKVRIEIDENMSEDEIVIRCAQPDERVLKMKYFKIWRSFHENNIL